MKNSILEQLKEGQGVKVDGTAKFDDYANEITIMANNVIKSSFKLNKKDGDETGERLESQRKRVRLFMVEA